MKVVVYSNSRTGRMAILYPAYNDLARPVGETDDECLARAMANSIPEGTVTHIIEDTELPTDRYFRNAWEWND
tara:strand:+ start:412 stop:630 length:219 start_codon:yes stop_codon:yes gene_type:complete